MSAEDDDGIDFLDILVLTVAAAAIVMYLVNKFMSKKSAPALKRSPSQESIEVINDHDGDLAKAMRNADKNVLIIYGSQTGTAEEFAGRLSQDARAFGLRAIVTDPQDFEMNTLENVKEIENALVLFCVATYGEGDPTDNAQAFVDLIKDQDLDLTGLRFAVFGLGNSTYDQFNSMGKLVDEKMAKFKGVRMTELGLGDDDKNIDDDFVEWKEKLWASVCKEFNIDPETAKNQVLREFKVKDYDGPEHRIFKGEIGFRGSFERQRGPYSIKNPFLAPVDEIRELFNCQERSCLHVELNIKGSRLRYKAGDHVAVYPINHLDLVEQLAARCEVDLDHVVRFKAIDDYATKKTPFPSPCSYRTALMHYVDITTPPGPHVLRALVKYAEDEGERKKIERLSSKEGKKEFLAWSEDRTIFDVLEAFPSLKPDFNHLLEVLPRLQPRYYSISSSPKAHQEQIHVTAAVVKYTAAMKKERLGVCTNYLSRQLSGSGKVPIFVRESTFRLPDDPKTPIIMIGPGTGLAPFRGFLEERQSLKEQGKELGPAMLFFGCQYEQRHFLYADQLKAWHDDGIVELHTAFSRDQPQKVYVTHRLKEQEKRVWEYISQNGCVYVCGDARNMAHDVHEILTNIFQTHGGKTKADAEKFLEQMKSNKRYQLDVWS